MSLSSLHPSADQIRSALRSGTIESALPLLSAAIKACSPAASNDDQSLPLLDAVAREIAVDSQSPEDIVDALWLLLNTDAAPTVKDPKSDGAVASASPHYSGVAVLLRLLRTPEYASKIRPSVRDLVFGCFPAEVLHAGGWISDDKDLAKRLRLYNTQTFYKQHRFHLLAEESQGYAKYLSLLVRHTCAVKDVDGCHGVADACRRIMGTFSLDPNRCTDLAVDVMIWQMLADGGGEDDDASPFSSWQKLDSLLAPWRPLLEDALSTRHLPPLLNFKLQNLPEGVDGSEADYRSRRSALWHVMAWLASRGLLSTSEMLQYLPPCSLPTVYRDHCQAERQRIRSLSRVRLAGTDAAADADELGAAVATKQRLADEPVVQWIRTFLQLGQFDRVRDCFERAWWSHLCALFPQLGVQLLQGGLPRQVVVRAVANMPPWTATAHTSGTAGAELTAGDNNADITADFERLYDVLSIVYESGCLALVPTTFTLLCRWVAAHHDHPAAPKLMQNFLLPSLSLFEANPIASQEVWAVVRHFSYQTRYLQYHAWRLGGGDAAQPPNSKERRLWLLEGEAMALKSARYSLKRLSKDTIRDQSRAVAKVCHAHPLVVFTTILGQIESYDNLVAVMVEALRYATPLSLDVLSFCILSRLSATGTGESTAGAVNRSRLKEDGVNLSQWLQSLESFVGAFYKRFPSVEFRGLLCYLMHRLKDGHVMEIGLLRTLLKTSAGWAFADYSPAASLSSSQLEGLSGSTQLKRETMSFGVVEAVNPRASKEIRTVLQSRSIGVSLLILLAQVRHHIVFGGSKESSSKRPVKLVAHLVDSCQVLAAILLEFLTDPSDTAGGERAAATEALRLYGVSLPSLQKLASVYGIDCASCWMLCRPLKRAAALQQIPDSGDSGSGDAQPMEMDGLDPFDGSHQLYRNMLPSTSWSYFTTDLFETFFTYSLYDLVHPEEVYVAETARLEKQVERLAQQKSSAMSPAIQPVNAPPRSDEEEQNRMKQVITRLETDNESQKQHVAAVRRVIASKRDKFFVCESVTKESACEFFSRCVYPRCMQGPGEALHCAAFISILHEERTPGFGTLYLLDSLVVTLSRSLFGLTEGEAANVSILLLETWKVVSRWRYNDSDFESQLAGTPGSYMSLNGREPEPVSHQAFCSLYNKWHAEIGAVAVGCLASPQYIHIRNCLIVLTRMVESFPTRPGLANKLLEALEPLQDESNSFADIRASAQAYSKQLLRARDDGVWKEESAAAVRARQEKEQSAAAARQEQAKLLMEEIEREAAQISEQIGDQQRRPSDRRRLDVRPGPGDAAIGGVTSSRRLGSGPTFEPPPPPPRGTTSASPPPVRSSGGDGPARRERDLAREDRRPDQSEGATLSVPSSSYTALDTRAGGSAADRARAGGAREAGARVRSLEDRWQRAGGSGTDRDSDRGGGRKRSRPPSPAEEGEATRDDSRPPKRTKADSGDEGGGGDNRRKKARRGRG